MGRLFVVPVPITSSQDLVTAHWSPQHELTGENLKHPASSVPHFNHQHIIVFKLLFSLALCWVAADSEIQVFSAENQELSSVLSFES